MTTTGTVLLSVSTWPSTTEFTALAAALLCRACQALMTVSLRIVFFENAENDAGVGLGKGFGSRETGFLGEEWGER